MLPNGRLKRRIMGTRCYEENNGELCNNLLALSPRWILNTAPHDEDFGKCAVIDQ